MSDIPIDNSFVVQDEDIKSGDKGSPSITSIEDCERPSVHANVHTGSTSAMNDCASATATSPLVTEQHQGSGGSVEVEEQE